jgi:hypothetical protein
MSWVRSSRLATAVVVVAQHAAPLQPSLDLAREFLFSTVQRTID